MLVKTTDGTPDAVKVARPVWSGGKSGDNFKGLPITIAENTATPALGRLPNLTCNITGFFIHIGKHVRQV